MMNFYFYYDYNALIYSNLEFALFFKLVYTFKIYSYTMPYWFDFGILEYNLPKIIQRCIKAIFFFHKVYLK